MKLTDIAVKRPVLASVLSLLMIAFGLVSFERLPLREYPDIDAPVVSISTNYPGAAATVVESRITQLIEDRIAGVAGIRFISSSSSDGRSSVTIEFDSSRDIESATNDIRDRVARITGNLPETADPPEVTKADADERVIMWLNLSSSTMDVLELTDYAKRNLEDRFSVLPGVARVRIGGGQEYAMRVWLDRAALAARGLTVSDIESALRSENVELPAGQVEGRDTLFSVRVERSYRTVSDFQSLVIGRASDGRLVRLADVARVERGPLEDRLMFRGNGVAMVGLGMVKQSSANTITVARAAKALKDRLNRNLPDGTRIEQSYDSSVFIEQAIQEVWKTLAIAVGLVVVVIFLFLRSWRATIIPAVTVPVSLVATFIALNALGFSLNLLTLLAMVLAVGLVVDDSIVMLENIYRRMEQGESALLAAYRGARQVSFAVVATSIVLLAVFVPIAFLSGDIGRLFAEFALTLAAAVFFSTIVALTLSPMLCSVLLKTAKTTKTKMVTEQQDQALSIWQRGYSKLLIAAIRHAWLTVILLIGVSYGIYWLSQETPSEYAPSEDRGGFFIMVKGPVGSTFSYSLDYMNEIEQRLMPLVEGGEVKRLLVRAPRSFGSATSFDGGFVIMVLEDWSVRRPATEIMADVRRRIGNLPGVRAFPIMRQGFGGGVSKPVQFVLGGGSYEELQQWRNQLNAAIASDNPGLLGPDWDYEETQPQLAIQINRNRAADLGVSVVDIGSSLQSMLGSKRVTTYLERGEEYDVILQGERELHREQSSIDNIYVRSQSTGQLIPLSNLVTIEEQSGALSLQRYNRVRAITLEANLAEGLTLDDALQWLEGKVRTELPQDAVIDYKGQSQDLRESSGSLQFVFALGLIVTFLVLAAQFESYVQPLVIMLTVPLAIVGALLGLWLAESSLNIYSQIGLVMLIGLAAKNGILIVEFSNQLRDQGVEFMQALVTASQQRLRPIVMTGITTAAGAVPLILSSGAGAETRYTIGVVVLTGVLVASVFTLLVVPVAYAILARKLGSPGARAQRIAEQSAQQPAQQVGGESV